MRISYGDKSNEELLFTYGFAVPGNPNDVALLAPPLPPAVEVDDVLQMRLALCEELGVAPRAFLPLSALKKGRKAAEAELLGAQRCLPLERTFLKAVALAWASSLGRLTGAPRRRSAVLVRRCAAALCGLLPDSRRARCASHRPGGGRRRCATAVLIILACSIEAYSSRINWHRFLRSQLTLPALL